MHKNVTVLAVDDDAHILEIVKATLAPMGYRVHLAANGKEALAMAEKTEPIDLLLTDVMMPEINGIELADSFMSRYPGTRIMFMSGYLCPSLGKADAAEAEKTFLQKPFTPKGLVSKLKSVLSHPLPAR